MSGGEANHLGDALSAVLDGELSPADEAAARGHLATCPACLEELESLRSVRSLVRGLPPQPPPLGFLDRVARPHHPTGQRRRRRVGVAALAASAAASFGVLLLSSPTGAPVSPQMVRFVETHATSASGDPISQLAPVAIPVTFRR